MALMKRMIKIYFGTKKPYNDLENKYLEIEYTFFYNTLLGNIFLKHINKS